MLKVGMIGFGGIAQAAHLKPYIELEKAGKAKLVAVCDVCPERFEQKLEINIGGSDVSLADDVVKYADYREMLKNEALDMVDICVPTYLHASVAMDAMQAGCHVLCEKPMSLEYEACKEMIEVSKRCGKRLMIGQSPRFGVPYIYTKELVDKKVYGDVKSAIFQRFSTNPVWGWDNWYMDIKRSGGCITDLHVHDIDYIQFVFGKPDAVSCCTQDIYSGKDIVHSRLMYKDFSVMAMSDWSREGAPFESSCSIAFEKATLIRKGGEITIYPRGGEAFTPKFESVNAHRAEIEYFVDCITNDTENTFCTPESSSVTIKLINTLNESADQGGAFVPFDA